MLNQIFRTLLFILILNTLLNAQHDENEPEEIKISSERPLVIIKENFMETINQPEFGTLVMFYAPWCGHCKRMVNIWNQLSKKYNNKQKFNIAKVDCTDQTELCSDKDVLAYPTFLFFKRGQNEGNSYDGERTLDSIEAFMYNQVQVQQTQDTEEVTLETPVYELDENNFESFISKGFHFVKFFAPWCGHCKMMEPTWEELGKKYLKSQVKISKVDCTKYGIVCTSNSVRGYPTLILFHNGKQIEFYAGKRTVEDFSSFIEGNIQRLDDMDEHSALRGKVLELTTDSFKFFLENSNLVFVKFYAPWCGHCKSMAEEWINLAAKLENNKKILIAEVDCTKHTDVCSKQDVEGYPSIFLYKNGLKQTEYSGLRKADSFIEFLNSYLQHDDL